MREGKGKFFVKVEKARATPGHAASITILVRVDCCIHRQAVKAATFADVLQYEQDILDVSCQPEALTIDWLLLICTDDLDDKTAIGLTAQTTRTSE
ncbi:hypothetical protein TNCV_4734631 [Trichonephila clavipes]|nr:hypothetical protein TNCV_4734631 [Trichonephila clavipes]